VRKGIGGQKENIDALTLERKSLGGTGITNVTRQGPGSVTALWNEKGVKAGGGGDSCGSSKSGRKAKGPRGWGERGETTRGAPAGSLQLHCGGV